MQVEEFHSVEELHKKGLPGSVWFHEYVLGQGLSQIKGCECKLKLDERGETQWIQGGRPETQDALRELIPNLTEQYQMHRTFVEEVLASILRLLFIFPGLLQVIFGTSGNTNLSKFGCTQKKHKGSKKFTGSLPVGAMVALMLSLIHI